MIPQDDFVPTVLPRRVTFGQWYTTNNGKSCQAACYINNHYVDTAYRGYDEGGSFARIGLESPFYDNLVEAVKHF